jgi:FMN phosphatase YigB (HAD superfamily)
MNQPATIPAEPRLQPVNLIFDLGGVLLNLDIQQTQDAFTKLGIGEVHELFRIGHAASFVKDYEVGTITDDEFVAAALERAHAGATPGQILTAWNAMLLDFPAERVQLLHKLKNKYRLFLFSNTNALHLQYFHQNYLDVYGAPMDSLFEKAYYSHLINRRKPDVAAFEYVINDSGLNPAETLFIDDAMVNVEGARQAGLQAIHLIPGKTILDLGL